MKSIKLRKINLCPWFLLAYVLIAGCKDDNPFDGTDGYISSFRLEQQGTALNGVISDGSIVLTVPENLSLDGATATIIISENASIDPDPSTITDWDQAQSFTVSSYNGTKKTYSYSVTRSNSISDGSISLLTQDEVEAFAALGISEIRGSLTIGQLTGESPEDSISSLTSLSGLKIIESDLIIHPTFSGSDLSGLQTLEQVGSIQIGKVTNLKETTFPALKSVMKDIIVTNARITSLEFPELVHVDHEINLSGVDSLKVMEFPKLEQVVEDVSLKGSSANNRMSVIEFPLLTSIGGDLTFSYWPRCTVISLPELTAASSLSISSLSFLETVDMRKLQKVWSELKLSSCSALTLLNLPSLVSVEGSVSLSSLSALQNFNMESLTTVEGSLTLSSLTSLQNLNGLKSLTTIGGTLSLSSLSIKNLSGLAALKNLAALSINNYNILTIEEIDVRNFENLTSITLNNIYNPFKLIGNDVFKGQLTVYYSNAQIDGFREVNTLSVTGFNTVVQVEDMTIGTEKVTGNLNLSIANITGKFSMPNLKEVGGILTYSGKARPEFPMLETAGNMDLAASFNDVLSLPSLQTVVGDCKIVSGNYQGQATDIQMPSLTTIGGLLTISGYSSSYGNSTMTSLDGFAALTSVAGVTISYNTALVNYSGLKNALASFSSNKWSATYNAYNPSYQDLLDGKWIRP
jgi:hypothetical protein